MVRLIDNQRGDAVSYVLTKLCRRALTEGAHCSNDDIAHFEKVKIIAPSRAPGDDPNNRVEGCVGQIAEPSEQSQRHELSGGLLAQDIRRHYHEQCAIYVRNEHAEHRLGLSSASWHDDGGRIIPQAPVGSDCVERPELGRSKSWDNYSVRVHCFRTEAKCLLPRLPNPRVQSFPAAVGEHVLHFFEPTVGNPATLACIIKAQDTINFWRPGQSVLLRDKDLLPIGKSVNYLASPGGYPNLVDLPDFDGVRRRDNIMKGADRVLSRPNCQRWQCKRLVHSEDCAHG